MKPRALLSLWPGAKIPWLELGTFPTPVQQVTERIWVKRDDLSSELYGGNKVRTLELLLADAKSRGCTRIYSSGAYGSNHSVATMIHAPRVGLDAGVIAFPQPPSVTALENARVICGGRGHVVSLPHWSWLPLAVAWTRVREPESTVMVPGGATPLGALAYISAGLELAQQVSDGVLPVPERIVVGVGSTCTSAGLLVGLQIAAMLGIGWRTAPRLSSVRVTPWPVTSAYRIVGLAHRAAELLSEIVGEPRLRYSRSVLGRPLDVDGSQLGRGYGIPTEAGGRAIQFWRDHAGLELDTTYSAKAAAAIANAREERLLFWSTKSTAPLPRVSAADWQAGPAAMVRWIRRAESQCPAAP